MDIRLIALDIDDTLVDHSSIIPQRSLNALRKAQEQGVEIVLATGRGYLGTVAIRRQLGEGCAPYPPVPHGGGCGDLHPHRQ